ncbi:MAG: glycoside hydrolase family 32 protein [Cyclobacteriaceae bacterium]
MNHSAILFAIIFCGCASTIKQEESLQSTSGGEEYRPVYHFTPSGNWMNDPNGMVYFKGEYHLFYQHYPDSNVWGPMHWGHAVSTDMVNWEHLPIALYPDSLGYIFSGSAVIDWQNTTGFGTADNPAMVAIYTYHDPVGADSGAVDFQYQGIAYSLDKGRSWTKYENNPVLPNPGIIDFRDPKVFWNESFGQWTMILAVKDHINLYSSPNLVDWTLESEFGQTIGAHGGVWECPDLFQLTDQNGLAQWVMLVSINPGGPQGGSATQYLVGDFDGSVFTPADTVTRWVDHGADNYAGVTWSDVPQSDGRRLFLGWMSNWQYANVVPTYNWRSAMTIPRELKLKTIEGKPILQSVPVAELETLFGDIQLVGSGVKIGADAFRVDVYGLPDKDFELVLSNAKAERLVIALNSNELIVDRTAAGISSFEKAFSAVHRAPLPAVDIDRLQIYVDRASVEVFVNDGQVVLTDLVFPTEPYNTITYSNGAKVGIAPVKTVSQEL